MLVFSGFWVVTANNSSGQFSCCSKAPAEASPSPPPAAQLDVPGNFPSRQSLGSCVRAGQSGLAFFKFFLSFQAFSGPQIS